MRMHLQLAATTLLLTATAAHAQITNPDKLIAPPPQNPSRAQRPAPISDLQWMWQYAKPEPNGRAFDLRLDGRFQSMLEHEFKQPQAMWGSTTARQPLSVTIPIFLTKYGAVNAEANRYYTVDGCVPRFCPAHGLLWVDLGKPHPLMVFAAVTWTTENHATDESGANFDLWLFANQPISADALPFPLTQSLAHWDARLAAAHRGVPHIAHALLVEPDGRPYSIDPALAGANTLKPQPDTLTPPESDN